jgi:Fe-S cluster assembly scaffold protein SufB
MIERYDYLDTINRDYNALIALLIMYVETITVTVQIREDAEPETVLIDNVDLICEELEGMTDLEMEELKQVISNDVKDYDPVRYTLKGDIRCPHCGNRHDEIPCTIADLIFQKVRRMLE